MVWYREPVIWLAAFVLVGSLAGCIWMIVLGARHADEPIAPDAQVILKMPLNRPAAPSATPPAEQERP